MTPFALAMRYVNITELKEKGKDHPLIQWWLSLCGFGLDAPDTIPWCSAFVNGIAWELRLQRSKSAAARSWLDVGTPVEFWGINAKVGFDVVVLKRGDNPVQGHVGFYAGQDGQNVLLLAGNQGDQVCIRPFPANDVLGVRRLAGA